MAAAAQGLLVGRLVERFGEARVLIAGLAGTAAGLLLVAVSESLWALLPGLAVLAVASGLVFSTTTALISLAAHDARAGLGARPHGRRGRGRAHRRARSSPRCCSSTPASRRR